MRKDSSLTEQQRIAVLALFEEGYGSQSVATHLGIGVRAVETLNMRWRVRGRGALAPKSTNQTYAFETKLEVVLRFLGGETKIALAQEFGMSSPKTVSVWARRYEREGEDGLRPKPKGRPRKAEPAEMSELERVQQENEYLRVKVAYLEKLKALRALEQQ